MIVYLILFDICSVKRYNDRYMDKLFTIAEVAALLRISKPSLYRLLSSGEIKSVKLGGRTLFKESEVERFINSLESKKNGLAING